jgi:alpha-tubulin suppressor-like RCC1 family protein
MAITDDGTNKILYSFGNPVALGINDIPSYYPGQVSGGGTNWKQVAGGNVHTAAIKTDGTLWTWGNNSYGQLGDNTENGRSTPVTTFVGGTNWKQVAGGYRHTAAIKTDGTLWTWGINTNGQLARFHNIYTPVTTFAGGTNWKQVAGGYGYTAAIKTDGTLWTWGTNTSGQLGDNTNINRSTPVTTFAGGTNWSQVSSGTNFTAAIKTDGTLWTWGANTSGQLGVNTATNRLTPVTTFAGGTNWSQVACGNSHTAAIKTDGTLWTWGSGSSGSLGDNTAISRSTPVTTFAGGTNWSQVACGQQHTAAIKTDGTLWVWGINGLGQLGTNNTTDRSTPVTTFAGGTDWSQVAGGNFFTAAIKTDGTLWTWGVNTSGQLGINNTTNQIVTPVTTFAGGTNWKQVTCGTQHTAAVKTDATLWTWGANTVGQLGDNTFITRSTPVTTFAGGTNWSQVSYGTFFNHTMAITDNGTNKILYGFGNITGLGINDARNIYPGEVYGGGTTWKQVSCDYVTNTNSSSAIKTDGTLWVWGSNSGGQLGTNSAGGASVNNRLTPVTTFAGGTNWKQVTCGNQFTAATTYIDSYQ